MQPIIGASKVLTLRILLEACSLFCKHSQTLRGRNGLQPSILGAASAKVATGLVAIGTLRERSDSI